MVVWLASGQPLTAWVRPVLKFALPVVCAIAVLAAFLSPWAHYSAVQYREQLSARSDMSQVSPGSFHEAKRGQRVFFVENVAMDATKVGNVFATSFQDGKLGVVVAQTGHQETAENGDRFVVLESGRRYEVEPGSPAFKVMEFERYRIRIQDGKTRTPSWTPDSLPLPELILDDRRVARAELLWRIAMPVSALILALLAIPLSYVNPRAGRSANMFIAVLMYAIYSNLISVSQAWVAQGKLSFWIGVWAIHAVMLLPLALLFYRRTILRMPWLGRTA
jgi:lipopolysaccharide export system permease protein